MTFMIEVTRTYLQMTSPDQHQRAEYGPEFPVVHAGKCTPSFYRFLYSEVGRNYRWVNRLLWTLDQIAAHLAQGTVSIWILSVEGTPAGYFELQQHPDGSTEIAYFGLMPEFMGQGLGKRLLSFAIDRAWETRAGRVWLHTCTLDDPAAYPNYLKRGFSPFKQEVYCVEADQHR